MGVHELQDREQGVIESVLDRVARQGRRSEGVEAAPLAGRSPARPVVARSTFGDGPPVVRPGLPAARPRVDRPSVDRGPVAPLPSGIGVGGTRCAGPVVVDVGYRMGRWGRLATTVTVLVAGLAVALSLPTDPVPAPTRQVAVHSGETLWELAGRIAPTVEAAVFIDQVGVLNPGVSDTVEPGTVLTVPNAG